MAAHSRKRSFGEIEYGSASEDEENVDDSEQWQSHSEGALVQLSEAFLETAFRSKLENVTRRKRLEIFGMPDCPAVQCPKIDPVVLANISRDAAKTDRAVSRIQRSWLDAANSLIKLLEQGELNPNDAVSHIQTSLVLLGNASQQHSAERRKALMHASAQSSAKDSGPGYGLYQSYPQPLW